MRKLAIIVLLTLLFSTLTSASIYDQYYEESKKIAQAMTLEQKIGQTIQADIEQFTEKDKQVTDPTKAIQYSLGSVLISGNAAPTTDGNLAKIPSYIEQQKMKDVFLKATASNWKKLADRFSNIGVPVTTKDNKKYLIKLLLGTDAVHGDQHSVGNILFPHNLGLSCSHNADHFQNVGFWTKEGVKKSGFNYVFAPTVAVSHNPQWGRFYETMGQEDSFIQDYASAFIKGLQDVKNGKINGALGTAKHFFGDGSTLYGANEGSATVLSFKKYIDHNIQGYIGAANEEVGSVMVSYSAINFIPNSYNSLFLSGTLKDDINFKGFTISDYDEVVRTQTMSLPRTFMNMTEERGYALMMNAGVDMIMLSGQKLLLQSLLVRIVKEAKKAVEKSLLFEERLEEAVTRILQVKMAMGLVTAPTDDSKGAQRITVPESSSGNQYQDSLNAIHESLVVLKNTNTIPLKGLKSDIKYVVMVGQKVINLNRLTRIQLFRNFDDIGMQSGGWSVRWQGFRGNDYWSDENKKSSNASSILDAVKTIQGTNNFNLLYPNYTSLTNEVTIENERRQYIDKLKSIRKNMTSKNTVIIGVFGEQPYAESEGDVNIPYCQTEGAQFCLYNPFLNPYVPGNQPESLSLEFSKFQKEVVSEVRGLDKSIPLVSVILSGRPRLIDEIYADSSAVVLGWLPGTSGGHGIMDAITGDYVVRAGGVSNKKNSLSMDWPRNMQSLKTFPIYGTDGEIPRISDRLFEVGYGLSTEVGNLRDE